MSSCQIYGNKFNSSYSSKTCQTCRKDIELKDDIAILIKEVKFIQDTYNVTFNEAVSIIRLQILKNIENKLQYGLSEIDRSIGCINPY